VTTLVARLSCRAADEKPLCSTTLTNDSIDETRSIAHLLVLPVMSDCSGSGGALKVGFYCLDVTEIRVRREDSKALI
jgi:hypothetical protein